MANKVIASPWSSATSSQLMAEPVRLSRFAGRRCRLLGRGGAGVHRFDVQGEIFALVLAATGDVEGDAHQLQGFEVGAGCEDFIGHFVSSGNPHNGEAVFGLAIRLIAVKDLHVFGAIDFGFLCAEKCDFHG